MGSNVLTIVVMTRDRVDLLKKALQSVFEHQEDIPPVIVSNNSTREHPEMEELGRQYGFRYVRQSGHLTATQHHNACLRLAQTPWVWILHDDDELSPGAVGRIDACLRDSEKVGIVIGGVDDITAAGDVIRHWLPAVPGVLRDDSALEAVGAHWGLRAPSQIFSTRESIQIGGFQEASGYPSDVVFACTLAYRHGVRFCPEVIGRFRMGTHQTSDVQSDAQVRRWTSFLGKQVQRIRSLGADPVATGRVADALMWNHVFQYVRDGAIEDNPRLMYHLKKQAVKHAPDAGPWRQRVQNHFPHLFWGPGRLAWPLFRVFRRAKHLWGSVSRRREKAGLAACLACEKLLQLADAVHFG